MHVLARQHGRERRRKAWLRHLPGEYVAHTAEFGQVAGHDVERKFLVEGRREKGEAANMIPVNMRQQKGRLFHFLAIQSVAQIANAPVPASRMIRVPPQETSTQLVLPPIAI